MKNRNYYQILYCTILIVFFETSTSVAAVSTSVGANTFECILEPEIVTELGSSIPGLIETVKVKRGDEVKKGQVVATLVSDTERAAVNIAQARVNATAQLKTAEIRKAFSIRKYERMKELSDKNHISTFNLDEVETEKYLAEAQLVEVFENMELAKAELKRAKIHLEMKVIKSPFNGVVTDRYYNPAERVDDKPILMLVKVDPLYVETLLPVSMLGKITKGMQGVVNTELNKNANLIAKVTVVDSVVDAASGYFRIRLELPNKRREIMAGLECTVSFKSNP